MPKPRVLYWHRTDLRVHDSPALQAALKLQPEALYNVFCFDPHYVYNQFVGPNRFRFLLDSMSDLSDNIRKINKDSQLLVVRGPPTTVLPALFKQWNITHLVFEVDDEKYAVARDQELSEKAAEAGVEVTQEVGHTLFDHKELMRLCNNHPPLSYGPFVKLTEKATAPPKPFPVPSSLPPMGNTDVSSLSRKNHSVTPFQQEDLNAQFKDHEESIYDTIAGPDGAFSVPTFKELGLQESTSPHRGGETRALAVLDDWLQNKKKEILAFEKPKTSPAAFMPPQTTVLSPHLKFGCLSPRRFYWAIKDIYKGQKHSDPPMSLEGQLLWREFFRLANYGTENFQQIRGNPVSRYIDWKLQNQYDDEGQLLPRSQWEHGDEEAEEQYKAWEEGRTGFPWIDGLMRQLRTEGWMHHLARHSVACFLTRGQLYISWERGAETFDRWLVDWDPAVNSANWMWLSASAFFSQWFRVYSPIAFGKKWDKSGHLIRHYCPELKDYPDKYIYEPWKAPIAEQKKAGCIIGQDYPKPIIDDKEAKEECLSKLKHAYEVNKHGNDPKVLDGSISELFGGSGSPEGAKAGSSSKRKAEAGGSSTSPKKGKPNEKITNFFSK